MTDYKEILQKPPTPRYIGNYVVTPHTPPQLKQPGGAHLTINIGINIYPNSIPYQIRDLVLNGLMTKDNAIKYLEKLIEHAEEVLRELRE